MQRPAHMYCGVSSLHRLGLGDIEVAAHIRVCQMVDSLNALAQWQISHTEIVKLALPFLLLPLPLALSCLLFAVAGGGKYQWAHFGVHIL